MPRSLRPILDAAAGNVLAMIALHQDRPCPTNAEIRDWTAVPRRRVASFLEGLVTRGIIEIETNERLQRRMRAVGGVWTGWTLRGLHVAAPIPAAAAGRLLALIDRHRDRPCPTVAVIAKRTGVAPRQVRPFLEGLVARGVIEIEDRRGGRRRLRAAGGAWTGWTVRRGNRVRGVPADATERLLDLIARRRDRPCPTVSEIAAALDAPRQRIAPFLARLAARGVIEIKGGCKRGAPRCLRAAGGAWTGWTRRHRR
jgi:DNA-binding IscR family transcriptional regulator